MGHRASSTEGTATGRSGCSDHQSRPARRWPLVCAGVVAQQSTARLVQQTMTLHNVVDLDFGMTRLVIGITCELVLTIHLIRLAGQSIQRPVPSKRPSGTVFSLQIGFYVRLREPDRLELSPGKQAG